MEKGFTPLQKESGRKNCALFVRGFTPLEKESSAKNNALFLTGFTIIELIVVMVIIGILAALGIPQYQKSVERSRAAEAYNILGELRSAAVRYYNEHAFWTTDISQTDFAAPDYNNTPGFSGKYFIYNILDVSVVPTPPVANSIRRTDVDWPGGTPYTTNIYVNGTIVGGPP